MAFAHRKKRLDASLQEHRTITMNLSCTVGDEDGIMSNNSWP
jgi:hypothetical protein